MIRLGAVVVDGEVDPRAGVPTVLADLKGDLSGLAQAGQSNDKITQRAKVTRGMFGNRRRR